MKKICSLILSFVVLATVAYGANIPADKDWEKISDENGIVAYRKDVANSDLVAFRGETIVNAPIAKVANVLIDTPRKLEWVAKIVKAKNVRDISEYERIEYNHTASGFFIVRDRDFVFRAKAILDKPGKKVTFTLKSESDELAPPTGNVRGEIDNSSYVLTQLDAGKTKVEVEIHADPKGNLPKWLVNLFQKAWPSKTLDGIRKQCAKPDVVEHPGIKAYFAG